MKIDDLINIANALIRKLFTMNPNYTITRHSENNTIVVETLLERNKLPYYLSKIKLIGMDSSQILSCKIQNGALLRVFDESYLSKNNRQLKTNCLIKHYGEPKIVLTLELSYTSEKCTIGLFFKQNKTDWWRDLQYIDIPSIEDWELSI